MSDQPANGQQLAGIVQQHIEVLLDARDRYEKDKPLTDYIADSITKWSGSMVFVYVHVVIFSVWIAANVGLLGAEKFDPYPFGLLTTIVSLEAIFLSTFVLLSQNRQAALADRRADLDLQIDLLSEREITRILQLVDAIAKKLDIDVVPREEMRELKEDISPSDILHELDRKHRAPAAQPQGSQDDPKS